MKLIFALLLLVALATPVVADEVDDLIQTMNDSDSDVRADAADALGEIGDPRAVNPLILALNDSDSNVRLKAVKALGKIGDAKAIDPLIETFKYDSLQIREEAARALGEIGDPSVTSTLNCRIKP